MVYRKPPAINAGTGSVRPRCVTPDIDIPQAENHLQGHPSTGEPDWRVATFLNLLVAHDRHDCRGFLLAARRLKAAGLSVVAVSPTRPGRGA